jgi:cell division protein FtsA
MPGMIELGEDIFLKPVRRGIPKYSSALADMVAQPARCHRHGPARRGPPGPLRGFKVAQKSGSVKTAFGRFKDFIVGNF